MKSAIKNTSYLCFTLVFALTAKLNFADDSGTRKKLINSIPNSTMVKKLSAQDPVKLKGDVLPLSSLEQLKSYANLPDSQLVQLPKSENNAQMTLGEVRKKLQASEIEVKKGSFADKPYSNMRKTKDTSGVDAMYAAARAAGVADKAEALSKEIKINGQTSPTVWELAWGKPYFIESSDFKAPVAVKLQLLKQNQSFDLPIIQGSSRAGGVAFSIPSSVVGVYEQPAKIVLTDSDGAIYTTAPSTFYPHIVSKNFAQIPVKITPWGSSASVKLDSTGFSFEEKVVSDNPSNSGVAGTYMIYIENLSPHWTVERFAADVSAYQPSTCDSFFAEQSNSGPNSVHVYYSPASNEAESRSNPSKGMKVAVLPTLHCRSVYFSKQNRHLFKGKADVHLEVSGPEGVPINSI